MTFLQQARIFRNILWREAIALRANVGMFVLNAMVASPVFLFAFSIIMINMGTPKSFVPMMIASEVCSQALFLTWGSACGLGDDISGNRECSYFTRLPISANFAMIKYAVSSTAMSFLVGMSVMLTATTLLFNHVKIGCISIPKVLLGLIINGLLYGFIMIWVAARSRNMDQVSSTFMRILVPMWLIIFFSPWHILVKVLPAFGYIALISPTTYTTEAMRSAFLGPENFLNYWLCCGMSILFITIIAVCALRRLKRRLDYV